MKTNLVTCQLCFSEFVKDREGQKAHLRDFHKIDLKAIDNPSPLRYWFGEVGP